MFIDYLKILCGFHLALYTMKLVYLLPKMVDAGSKDVVDDWSLVVDMTDNLDSKVAPYACQDAEHIANLYRSYVRSTFVINLCQNRLKASGANASVENALAYAKNELKKDDSYYEFALQTVRNGLEDDDAGRSSMRSFSTLTGTTILTSTFTCWRSPTSVPHSTSIWASSLMLS